MRFKAGKYSLLVTVAVLLVAALLSFQQGGPDFERELAQVVSLLPTSSSVLGLQDGQQGISNQEIAIVKRVIDGDTIELSDGRKLRYIGVDTPETKAPQTPVECYGQQAAEFNQLLVEGKTVRLEKDVNDIDRYGRLLRYVYINDELVNLKLVAEGYAVARSYPPDISKQDEFRTAEAAARAAGKGLWSRCAVE